jgi:hypothetical protein
VAVFLRHTGWRWRSDYFDPEMPPALELHFRLWNSATESIEIPGLEQFWSRRAIRSLPGGQIPALSLPDTLSYAALHALRHLLRGDLCPYHIYELAHFLHHSRHDIEFWNLWSEAAGEPLRSLCSVPFHLAREWFGCSLPSAVAPLEARVEDWFRRFAFSPVADSPNKDELWLHLLLVGRRSARSIVIRRLLPRPPRVSFDPHARRETLLWSLRQQFYRARFLAARTFHHCRATAASVVHAARSSASHTSR